MQFVVPTLRISNYEASKAFYVEQLKFSIDWEWRHEPAHPVFMQISRGNAALYLSQHSGDCQPGGLVYLYVPSVDAWHRELAAEGVTAQHPPLDQPWGNREMRIRDPDDNCLCICTILRSQTIASADGESS